MNNQQESKVHYLSLSSIQRNALVLEHIKGWQWIDFDFDDVSMEGQRWLLPSVDSKEDIKNGEWTWFLEEDEVYPDGSVFPLERKDKRIVPSWLPRCFEDHSEALSLLKKFNFVTIEFKNVDYDSASSIAPVFVVHVYPGFSIDIGKERQTQRRGYATCCFLPEALCLAALRAKDIIDKQGYLLTDWS